MREWIQLVCKQCVTGTMVKIWENGSNWFATSVLLEPSTFWILLHLYVCQSAVSLWTIENYAAVIFEITFLNGWFENKKQTVVALSPGYYTRALRQIMGAYLSDSSQALSWANLWFTHSSSQRVPFSAVSVFVSVGFGKIIQLHSIYTYQIYNKHITAMITIK